MPGADHAAGEDEPEGAPLEYHIRLLDRYRATMDANGILPPPGYGPPGAGNAVFSVSSFMDTLPADTTIPDETPATV